MFRCRRQSAAFSNRLRAEEANCVQRYLHARQQLSDQAKSKVIRFAAIRDVYTVCLDFQLHSNGVAVRNASRKQCTVNNSAVVALRRSLQACECMYHNPSQSLNGFCITNCVKAK